MTISNTRSLVVHAGLAIAALAGVPRLAHAQSEFFNTCTPTNTLGAGCPAIAIPDDGTPVTLTINVPPAASGNNLVGRIVPKFWIKHTYQGDLLVELVSPAGTVVRLVNRPGTGPGGEPSFGYNSQDFGSFGFRDFGGITSTGFFPLRFVDPGSGGCTGLTQYNTPFVPLPGINYNQVWPFAFITVCDPTFTFSPVDPLSAFAGQSRVGTWTLRVRDLATGFAGTLRYFGLEVTPRIITQPTVELTAPTSGCVCDATPIVGTVADAGGAINSWRIDTSPQINGPWTPYATGSGSVTNATLAALNTNLFPESRQFIRLSATNDIGLTAQAYTEISIDRFFDAVSVTNLPSGGFIRGNYCVFGSISDSCSQNYRVDFNNGSGPFTPINPAQPTYTGNIIKDTIANWNTGALPDGSYTVRVQGTTACGNTSVVTRAVSIDNTPPVALITSPPPCSNVCGNIPIVGTAFDTNISGWSLQYTGGDARGWVTIASGTGNITNSTLANWNVSSLRRCAYVLRLVVVDRALDCSGHANSAEYLWPLTVGAYANCDGSTGSPALSPADFTCFLNAYRATPATCNN